MAKVLNSSKLLPRISDSLTIKLQEFTKNYVIPLRSSQTDYVSVTNPINCQFVAIHGIHGLCGIGVKTDMDFEYICI